MILDGDNRAVGVEYLKGEKLYRAHPHPRNESGERRQIHASREVILAGGTFNTPQLLMLSGIGARAALERHGIATRVDLPGVGKNLQDRYEIGVANRMNFGCWKVLQDAKFASGRSAVCPVGRIAQGCLHHQRVALRDHETRSTRERAVPDLFCFPLLTLFTGYFPNYSALAATHTNYLTWAILKAHTNNRAGEVTLRSGDPLDTPRINFHYFDEGSDDGGRRSRLGRRRHQIRAPGERTAQAVPAPRRRGSARPQRAIGRRAEAVRAQQRVGPSCLLHVPDRPEGSGRRADQRLQGARHDGLRVVDASVFPRIPGFFIVSAIYMISEKAADVILADARGK